MNKPTITKQIQIALLAAVFASSSCQKSITIAKRDDYQLYITRPSFVLVKGQFFANRFDSTSAMRGYRVIFLTQLADRSIEKVSTNKLSSEGVYRVRLKADKTYQVTVMVGDCRVETQEYYASNKTQDSVDTKNFYLSLPDSTAYGGCLAGWRPQLIKH